MGVEGGNGKQLEKEKKMAGRHKSHETCTLWFCDEPHYGRGLCATHYQNWLRSGKPLPSRAVDLRAVLIAVDKLSGAIDAFINSQNNYLITKDGEVIVQCRCKYCGSIAQYIQNIQHEDNCPVLIGERLIPGTKNAPTKEEYNYDDWKSNGDGNGEG